MTSYYKSFYDEGWCRHLVKNGYGDIKIKVGDEIIYSIKSILSSENTTFDKIIKDSECGDVIEVFEGVSMTGFLEFEKFISGGKLVIEENNVIDIMLVCLYYNERLLFLEAKKYIENHLNFSLTQKLFEIYSFLDNNQLVDLKGNLLGYISNWNWKYIEDTNNNEFFIHLPLEILDYILSHTLILQNEYYLLKQLFTYYEMNIKTLKDDIESKKVKEYFFDFFKKIDYDKVTAKQIFVIDKLLSFDDITKSNNNNNNNSYNHIYISFEDEKNILKNDMKDLLFNKYMYLINGNNNNKDSEENDNNYLDFRNYNEENLLNENIENLEYIINEILLKNNDDIIIIIGLLLSIKMNIEVKLSPQLYVRLLTKYNDNNKDNNNNNNERIKLCLLKCLTLFMVESDNIKTLYNCCGKEILNEFIKHSEILNNNQKEMIIKFTKVNNIELEIFNNNNNNENNESNENNNNIIIYDKQINNLINMKIISEFHYEQNEYEFIVKNDNDNDSNSIELKPICDGTECTFELEDNNNNELLPEGLLLDKDTGIISGNVSAEIKDPISIKIIAKNRISEKKCEIKITSIDYKFSSNSIYNCSLSYNEKIVKRSSGIDHGMDGHSYLNIEMKNNEIYIFKFKFQENNNYSSSSLYSIGTTIIGIGAHKNNTFNGTRILYDSNSFGWYYDSLQSYLCVGGNTVVVNGNTFVNKNNDIYEVVFDMKTKDMKMGKNGSKPQLLIKKLPCPLYPFVVIGDIGNIVTLLSVTKS